jgi:hypothetical protein
MKWITRERVKVDRVACPWLIKKFIDPKAEFLFVPREEVLEVADREGAIPFDVPGVELGHHGGKCSFEALLARYEIDDPAVHLLPRSRMEPTWSKICLAVRRRLDWRLSPRVSVSGP